MLKLAESTSKAIDKDIKAGFNVRLNLNFRPCCINSIFEVLDWNHPEIGSTYRKAEQ